jgi:hypothetical protein
MKKRMYLFLFTKKERKKEIIFDIIEQKSMSILNSQVNKKEKIFKIIGQANLILHKSSSNIIRLKQNSSIDYFQLHKIILL